MTAASGLALIAGCENQPAEPNHPQTSAVQSAAATDQRYIVLLKQGQQNGTVSASAVTAVSAAVQSVGGRIERSHAATGILQVRGLTKESAARLAARPEVESIALDRTVQWLPPSENKAFGKKQFTGQSNQRGAFFFDQQWNLKKIKAQKAWDVSNQGAGVMVCILDTGVDPRHIDLEGKLDLSLSASFVGNERADRDFFFHGTAMAAIVSSNGLGVASVAPDARLCSVKVLTRTGSGTFGDAAAGIMYVGDAGIIDGGPRVQVANMSFGALFSKDEPGLNTLINALQRAINYSTNRGVLFVASAGNEATNLNGNMISLPAELDNVISVGATGPINQMNFDRIASYSNVGRQGVDVFAPGGDFGFKNSVLEDLIISACSPSTTLKDLAPCEPTDFVLLDGTSPAAAHVSGEAAVIESELAGNQTPARLTSCILNTADPLHNPLLTANGRINVLRAVGCSP
jgi:subtilisin family serine protease